MTLILLLIGNVNRDYMNYKIIWFCTLACLCTVQFPFCAQFHGLQDFKLTVI